MSTIAAIATPAGVGGIACVRISGGEAYEVAEKVFSPKDASKSVKAAKGYTAMYGSFMRGGEVCDEAVALFFRAPKSYTGEHTVEISCHGGTAVAQNLLAACLEAGADIAGAGEFTKRAFLNGRLTLTQAEAVMDIIEANTRQAAAAAFAAMQGALYRASRAVCDDLLKLQSHIAAYIDFPEEGVEELTDEEVRETVARCLSALAKLIESYTTSSIMKRGVRCAIIGSPNVGKSTLLNLLSGFERAIVTPVAGTTRDVIEQEINVQGIKLIVADTAGLHETSDMVEQIGVQRTNNEFEQAGLVIAVFDGSQPTSQQDIELAQRCSGKPSLAIINKTDLAQRFNAAAIAPHFNGVVKIAATDTGFLGAVHDALAAVLGTTTPNEDEAFIANLRQLSAAQKAHSALAGAQQALAAGLTPDVIGVEIDAALAAVYELTGESVSEAVIDEVFERFCVGK